jgi:hypothetical protein
VRATKGGRQQNLWITERARRGLGLAKGRKTATLTGFQSWSPVQTWANACSAAVNEEVSIAGKPRRLPLEHPEGRLGPIKASASSAPLVGFGAASGPVSGATTEDL